MWHDTAGQFARSLIDPCRAVPDGLTGDSARFNVYRNNVAVGLRDILGETFPVVRDLVGDEFFSAMARAFGQVSPPRSPVLIEYGGGFADFIDGFEPARPLPYLADVARLEWAWHESYHAADAEPMSIDVLTDRNPSDIENLHFQVHPSLRLMRSDWPVASIWQAHQADTTSDLSSLPKGGEQIMVVRPYLSVEVRSLEPAAFEFAERVASGAPLGRVLEDLGDHPEWDASACLGALFDVGAVCRVV
ncbi:MAG: DNA-binding domain-containing protein [Rhodospirillales bacterium]